MGQRFGWALLLAAVLVLSGACTASRPPTPTATATPTPTTPATQAGPAVEITATPAPDQAAEGTATPAPDQDAGDENTATPTEQPQDQATGEAGEQTPEPTPDVQVLIQRVQEAFSQPHTWERVSLSYSYRGTDGPQQFMRRTTMEFVKLFGISQEIYDLVQQGYEVTFVFFVFMDNAGNWRTWDGGGSIAIGGHPAVCVRLDSKTMERRGRFTAENADVQPGNEGGRLFIEQPRAKRSADKSILPSFMFGLRGINAHGNAANTSRRARQSLGLRGINAHGNVVDETGEMFFGIRLRDTGTGEEMFFAGELRTEPVSDKNKYLAQMSQGERETFNVNFTSISPQDIQAYSNWFRCDGSQE